MKKVAYRHSYIPITNRFRDGYFLNTLDLKKLRKDNFRYIDLYYHIRVMDKYQFTIKFPRID